MNLPGKFKFSNKHFLIDKANELILIAAASTIALIVFSIVATTTLSKQMTYQNKVIALRDSANKQLISNIRSADSIVSAYRTFESAKESVIGTADKNPKIILDALPSKYDFPALATSIDALVKGSGAKLVSMSGADNEALAEQNSTNPQPIDIPFDISATGSLANIQLLIERIEKSIRPIQIMSVTLNASGNEVQATLSVKTFYQPEKKSSIEPRTVSKDGQITPLSSEVKE